MAGRTFLCKIFVVLAEKFVGFFEKLYDYIIDNSRGIYYNISISKKFFATDGAWSTTWEQKIIFADRLGSSIYEK